MAGFKFLDLTSGLPYLWSRIKTLLANHDDNTQSHPSILNKITDTESSLKSYVQDYAIPASSTITLDHGGTGATTANDALVNLGADKAIKSITRSGTTFTYTCLDGTTGTFTQQDNNTTYTTATTSYPGLMSTTMVSKLNGIAEGANAYSLPTATSSILGGVKVGSNITVSSGTISLTKANVVDALGYTPPTTDTNTTYSTATSSTLGLVKIGYTTSGQNYAVQLSNGQMYVNVPWSNTTYGVASSSSSGLMSATDKAKLDGIASGANAYTLPTASSSTKGGVTIGSNITVSSGTISLTKTNVTDALGYTPPTTNTTYSIATTSTSGLLSASDKTKLDGITSSADSVSFSASLTSGTKIGTITINGTGTDLYCQTNTDTTYSAGTGLSLSGTTFSLSTVSVANGGTGATTASSARSNLGIRSGTSLPSSGSSGDIFFLY